MTAERSHPYDNLTLVKIFFFLTIVLMFNLLFVFTVYPFYFEAPFRTVIDEELASMHRFFGDDLTVRLLIRGDAIYDAVFVRSGFESVAYDFLLRRQEQEAMEVFKNIIGLGTTMDNFFDYMLLISYRMTSLLILSSVAFFFLFAVIADGFVRRTMRRYSFGDSGVVVNIWSRGFAGYAIPLFVILFTFPVHLHPVVIVSGLSAMALSITVFALTLPKLA